MVDVVIDMVIERPCERVAAFAADPDNAPAWYQNIKSVVWITPPAVKRGARMAFVGQFFGRTLQHTYEIAELEPGKRMVMRTKHGPFPIETTYTWEPLGNERTRMTLRNRGKPSGFSWMAVPWMAIAMRRAGRKDLARLKAVLEGRRR